MVPAFWFAGSGCPRHISPGAPPGWRILRNDRNPNLQIFNRTGAKQDAQALFLRDAPRVRQQADVGCPAFYLSPCTGTRPSSLLWARPPFALRCVLCGKPVLCPDVSPLWFIFCFASFATFSDSAAFRRLPIFPPGSPTPLPGRGLSLPRPRCCWSLRVCSSTGRFGK